MLAGRWCSRAAAALLPTHAPYPMPACTPVKAGHCSLCCCCDTAEPCVTLIPPAPLALCCVGVQAFLELLAEL